MCVCAVCSCVCPCLCMWRPEEDTSYFVFSLSYSLKIGSLSEPGVCWFSARLTGQQAAVSGSPVSACIALKWQARNCHACLFYMASGFQTLILVQQALLPAELCPQSCSSRRNLSVNFWLTVPSFGLKNDTCIVRILGRHFERIFNCLSLSEDSWDTWVSFFLPFSLSLPSCIPSLPPSL